MMDRNGEWHLAPAYDMTFIISSNGREPERNRCMPIAGKVADISEEDLIRLGRDNSVRNPSGIISDVRKGISIFEAAAQRNGVDSFHIELIAGRLSELNPDIGITVPGRKKFSFISSDGTVVENVRFERTESGNIHVTAQVNGRNAKYVVTNKKPLYQEILDSGFNAMPERKKEEIARIYLLRECK